MNANIMSDMDNYDLKINLHHVKQLDWHEMRGNLECLWIYFELGTNKELTCFYCPSVCANCLKLPKQSLHLHWDIIHFIVPLQVSIGNGIGFREDRLAAL